MSIFFLQEKEVNGIKFWCYHAGHVLGASMFMIEIAGVKVHTLHWLLKYHSVTTAVLFGAELTGKTIIITNLHYFLVEQILYTGDFSRQEDRHLMAAEIPSISPDVLIIVS